MHWCAAAWAVIARVISPLLVLAAQARCNANGGTSLALLLLLCVTSTCTALPDSDCWCHLPGSTFIASRNTSIKHAGTILSWRCCIRCASYKQFCHDSRPTAGTAGTHTLPDALGTLVMKLSHNAFMPTSPQIEVDVPRTCPTIRLFQHARIQQVCARACTWQRLFCHLLANFHCADAHQSVVHLGTSSPSKWLRSGHQ